MEMCTFIVHVANTKVFPILLQSLSYLSTCSKDFSSDHITKDVRSNVISDLSRRKVSFGEELRLEIFDESKPPITPLQTGNTSLNEPTQSDSHLRSVLKKTPVKQLMDSMKVS